MHGTKNLLVHDVNGNRKLLAQLIQGGAQLLHGDGGGGQVYHHHHHKVAGKDGLADVCNVDAVLGKKVAHLGDDAHLVCSYNGNDCVHTTMIIKKAPFGKGA